jgi:hypothetical protein
VARRKSGRRAKDPVEPFISFFVSIFIILISGLLKAAFASSKAKRTRSNGSKEYWKKYDWDVDGIEADGNIREEDR